LSSQIFKFGVSSSRSRRECLKLSPRNNRGLGSAAGAWGAGATGTELFHARRSRSIDCSQYSLGTEREILGTSCCGWKENKLMAPPSNSRGRLSSWTLDPERDFGLDAQRRRQCKAIGAEMSPRGKRLDQSLHTRPSSQFLCHGGAMTANTQRN